MDDIFQKEIEVLVKDGKYEDAKVIAEQIESEYFRNSEMDDILITQFDKLYENKEFDDAKNIANQITNDFIKSQCLRKLNKK